MIYALTKSRSDVPNVDEIADAILNDDAAKLAELVKSLPVVHILDTTRDSEYYCIYCDDNICPTNKIGSGISDWYFEHKNDPNCVGQGKNPSRQGCYVALGDSNHPRTQCRCKGYCDQATKQAPPCR